MATDPVDVWATMELKIWPERYVMLALDTDAASIAATAMTGAAGRYGCMLRDQAGISLLIDEASAADLRDDATAEFGPFRVVSTDGELPFDVVGFLGPAMKALNDQLVKAGPQCGTTHDHLFIYEDQLELGERILRDYIEAAAESRSKP